MGLASNSGRAMDVTWIACHRQRRVHAVPADVHSPAYDHPYGLIDAACGQTVYPLHIAEAGSRRCKQCTEELLPQESHEHATLAAAHPARPGFRLPWARTHKSDPVRR
jgi:hypothetical protein